MTQAGQSDVLHTQAVVDLLAALATAELAAFERIAADASNAPEVADEMALAAMAASEFRHFTLLRDRLVALGVDPAEAMAPFGPALRAFHSLTAPSDWIESLVKVFVGDGIALDFYRAIGGLLDDDTRALVEEVCADLGQASFVAARVRDAVAEDPRVSGRLALWGRRLMGETISQAQQVAAERPALTALLLGGGEGLPSLTELIARLSEGHTRRMDSLHLAP